MAMEFQVQVWIDRLPEDVFAALTDVASHAQWADGVDEVRELSDNPIKKGSTWVQVSSFLGQEMAGEATADTVEAPHTLKFTVLKPIKGFIVWTVEAVDGGSQVTMASEIEPSGILKLASAIMKSRIQTTMSGDMKRLKALLEQG